MTNKIIAQSSRFRAVRTSRDRVRIKSASGNIEFGSLVREGAGMPWFNPWFASNACQDLMTFVEAVHRTLEKEVK
jgi:hypothetical protein